MAKQSYSLLPDRKFRMLRVKHILENETDSAHSITMAQLLELLNEESDKCRSYRILTRKKRFILSSAAGLS